MSQIGSNASQSGISGAGASQSGISGAGAPPPVPHEEQRAVKCKFCKRRRFTITAAGVEIKWRRPRGQVCATCPMVQRAEPKFLENCDADQLVEDLEHDEKLHSSYLVEVNKWEAQRVQGKNNTAATFRTEAGRVAECRILSPLPEGGA